MELYLDAKGQFTTNDNAVKKIKATIPIDQPSADLRILDNGTVWLKFSEKGFKKKDADDLVTAASLKIEKENETRRKERERLDSEIKMLESRPGPLGPEQTARLEKLKKDRSECPDLLDLSPALLRDPAWGGLFNPRITRSWFRASSNSSNRMRQQNKILPQETPNEELLKGPWTFPAQRCSQRGASNPPATPQGCIGRLKTSVKDASIAIQETSGYLVPL